MKTILACLDTGLAQAYFFETVLARSLVSRDVRLVVLVREAQLPVIREKYAQPNVIFESMRDGQAERYRKAYRPRLQYWSEHIRRASASTRIPLTYVDTHRQRAERNATGNTRYSYLALRPFIYILRRSRLVRRLYVDALAKWFDTDFYTDLLDHYAPDLIVSNSAGWRLDQYILREAKKRGIRSALLVVGWDNPSSQGLPGVRMDYASVWSQVHRWELSAGVDWPEENIAVGGMPLYDGYISGKWVMPRRRYLKLHGLDPHKRLISFAATALSISPNLHLVKLLAEMVAGRSLDRPAQLLVRLHPNHFKARGHYLQEAEAIRAVACQHPDVHIVEPAEVPGGLERYSGEDFPEKASMLAHSDVLVTIYSTMVVEAALHDTPFISACIDTPGGWKKWFSVPLHEVPHWPTAARVNQHRAGRLALTPDELRCALNEYLAHPELDAEGRRSLIESELTYLGGEATAKTADYLLSLLDGAQK